MSQIRQSAMSLVTIVIFLVLMVIALVLYGGNAEQKAKMEKNIWWQKARFAVDYILLAGSNLIGTSSVKNTDEETLFHNINKQMADIESAKGMEGRGEEGAWSDLANKIRSEWEKDTATTEVGLGMAEENAKSLINFAWQKTESGAEIIFSTRNGSEHKFPLPFKFLSK